MTTISIGSGLDGKGFTQLTEGEGRHMPSTFPPRACFLPTRIPASTSSAPVTVLRSADGELLQTLGEADISRLENVGWVPPKEFVVKAADGETDLWVTMYFPLQLSTRVRQYPVVEYIYAGPQTTWRAMDFGLAEGPLGGIVNFYRGLANRGFIVVMLDGRGTPGRSKAYPRCGVQELGSVRDCRSLRGYSAARRAECVHGYGPGRHCRRVLGRTLYLPRPGPGAGCLQGGYQRSTRL